MKGILKAVKIAVLTVICSAVIGTLLLFAATAIPQKYLKFNSKQAAEILYKEGTYYNVFGEKKGHKLDNFTDGLMINTAYTSTGKWIDDALQATQTRYKQKKDSKKTENPMISFYRYIVKNEEGKYINRYPRYWHGYLSYLRPLLAVISFPKIRGLNMVLQITAIMAVLYGLIKRNQHYLCIPFLVMWISLSPAALFSSLQYIAGFYSTMFACVLLVWYSDKLNVSTRGIIFELTGILLAYLDLLAYPLVSIGIPLILYISMNCEKRTTFYEILKEISIYSIYWAVGYSGMWASKWIIGSLFTGQNIFLNAYKAAVVRTSHSSGEKMFTWLGVVKSNFDQMSTIAVIAAIIIAIVLFGIIILKNKRIFKNYPIQVCIFIVCCYPFIWYAIMMNHSGVHYWMTFRNLAITIYGVISIISICVYKEKSISLKTKKC